MIKPEDFLDGIGKSFRQFVMTADEKARQKELFVKFMEDKLAEPAVLSTSGNGTGVSVGPDVDGREGFRGFFSRFNPALLVLILTVTLGTGGVFASQNALPGDSLYLLKVEVIEKAQAEFATSAEYRAALNAEQAIRRLDEAKQLISVDVLHPEDCQLIDEKFEDRKKRLAEELRLLKLTNKEDTAAQIEYKFKTSLKERQEILNKVKKIAGGKKDKL